MARVKIDRAKNGKRERRSGVTGDADCVDSTTKVNFLCEEEHIGCVAQEFFSLREQRWSEGAGCDGDGLQQRARTSEGNGDDVQRRMNAG